jgi:hypothetical protein
MAIVALLKGKKGRRLAQEIQQDLTLRILPLTRTADAKLVRPGRCKGREPPNAKLIGSVPLHADCYSSRLSKIACKLVATYVAPGTPVMGDRYGHSGNDRRNWSWSFKERRSSASM